MKRSSWNDRLRRLALAAAFVTASSAVVLAQNYPQQPIKIILPFAAGGGADVVGRSVAEQLSEIVGQPVVIENVAGAGGTIGTGARGEVSGRRLHAVHRHAQHPRH